MLSEKIELRLETASRHTKRDVDRFLHGFRFYTEDT